MIAYIGIDPGKAGVITVKSKDELKFYYLPQHKVESGKTLKSGKPQMKSEFHLEGLRDLVFEIASDFKGCEFRGIIEQVLGRAGWSATNNFNFGNIAGIQQMVMVMLGVKEIQFVRPQKWQTYIWRHYKQEVIKVPSSTGKTLVNDTKTTSYNLVSKHYPDIDWRKTEKSKNFDDNKVDAFLIMQYLILTENK
jgi:hypothetical protein